MKIVLVDDERLLLKDLTQMLSVYDDVEIECQFTDPLTALKYIDSSTLDVVFIDINMPRLNGMDLAERILETRPDVEVVFITAYDEYAIKAFDINAFDYLLKPVEEERLERTIKKLRKVLETKNSVEMRQSLQVHFFGRFELLVDGNPIRWRSRKAQEFVAFLLSRPSKSAQKHIICDALYPEVEEKSALINIQSTASRARQSLADSGCDVQVIYNNDGYQLTMSKFTSDLDELTELCRNTAANSSRIRALFKDGYMAENGWLWSYSDAAIWDERLADIIEND